ncbi:hypothetical protein QQL37_10215 [Pantoea agglomerans]
MVYHDKTTGHMILGEAAINLAFDEQEITLVALIRQLSEMAEQERNDERVTQIADARNWLKGFIESSTRDRAELNWLVETGQAPVNLKDYRRCGHCCLFCAGAAPGLSAREAGQRGSGIVHVGQNLTRT